MPAKLSIKLNAFSNEVCVGVSLCCVRLYVHVGSADCIDYFAEKDEAPERPQQQSSS